MTEDRAKHLKRLGLALGALAALCIFAWVLGSSLLPLALAFVLAYLLFPVILRLEKYGVRRGVAVAGTFTIIILLTAVFLIELLPPLIRDLNELIREFPELLKKSLAWTEEALARFGFHVSLDRASLYSAAKEQLPKLSVATFAPAGKFIKSMFSSLAGLLTGLMNLFLIPVFFFYLIDNYEELTDGIFALLPQPWQPYARDLSKRFDRVLSGYIRGQVVICLILGGVYALGLTVSGVAFGPVIGFLAGLLNIIPYVGPTLGVLAALVVALADFSGWGAVAGVVITFAAGSTLEGLFLTPKIVGDKVGLGPLPTLLALVIGGNLAGLLGMLMAIPLAGILKLVLVELREKYFGSPLYT